MKKTFKIFIVITLFLIVLITKVNASGILMNLDNYVPTNSSEGTIIPSTDSLTTDETEIEDEDDSPRVVSTTSDDDFLTAENILSIIIIVIGLLLIFLAIAILIRIK